MMRWDLINSLIKEHGLNSYLEIGYQNGVCFDQIKCKEKYSVDPNGNAMYTGTSDEFFAHIPKHRIYDVVFVDGLHHAEQVERDICNAVNLVKAKFVVIHDCLPTSEESQRVPRETKVWFGDVWRAWKGLCKIFMPVCELFYTDCGVGVIDAREIKFIEAGFTDYETTFKEYFDSHSNSIPNR